MGLPKNRVITFAQMQAMTSPPAGVLFFVSDRDMYVVWHNGFWSEIKHTHLWDELLHEDFESGSMPSSMTVVNDTNNGWYVGTAEKYDGSDYGLYVSNDGGTTAAYSNSNVCHIYFDVAIPSNAQKWRLRSMWKCLAEVGYDYGRVYVDNTASYTPSAGHSVSDDVSSTLYQIGGDFNNQSNWVMGIIEQDNTEAGNTIRIIISFESDGSVIHNPPLCLDNLYVEYLKN